MLKSSRSYFVAKGPNFPLWLCDPPTQTKPVLFVIDPSLGAFPVCLVALPNLATQKPETQLH
jgi:hypothetical protein